MLNDRQPCLLARQAENIFWMARYVERAENLLRLLDITQTFSPGSSNAQNWQSILELHLDTPQFLASCPTVSAENVTRYYLTDENSPNSVMSCLANARQNSSTLRAIISTEMWVHINTLYNFMRGVKLEEYEPQEWHELFMELRSRCQAYTGVTESTLYRDQGWYFYQLGRQLERADQVTRLLDIKYHLLLPSVEDVGTSLDDQQWYALLRAAGGYHAFRRERPAELSPHTVAGFLLQAKRFPRSLASCLHAVKETLFILTRDYRLEAAEEAYAVSNDMIYKLESRDIELIIGNGLHEYLDNVQLGVIETTNRLGRLFI